MDLFENGMTALMYHYATDTALTIDEAKQKLYEDAYIRTVRETLAAYCGIDKADAERLKKVLTERLCETDPAADRESVAHAVRLWLNGGVQFLLRQNAVKVVFALRPDPADAEKLMFRLCGEGFHLRNAEDIVWWFALRQKMNYADARSLVAEMLSCVSLPENEAEDAETATAWIGNRAKQVSTKEELKAFLIESAPHLGAFHNTAYKIFSEYMDLLKQPEEPFDLVQGTETKNTAKMMPEERTMAVDEIVTAYLFKRMIPDGRRDKSVLQDAIKRDISMNWPGETALARMNTRKTDVTRKVLILLFLACDGGDSEYGDTGYDDPINSDGTPGTIFEDMKMRLDCMLKDCGFAPLDSRIPFDWMVLYCMVAQDTLEVDDRITGFLSEIFRPYEDGATDEK